MLNKLKLIKVTKADKITKSFFFFKKTIKIKLII